MEEKFTLFVQKFAVNAECYISAGGYVYIGIENYNDTAWYFIGDSSM